MNSFIQKHRSDVIGVLSGFDRLILRGTPRALAYVAGMKGFLWAKNVLLKDFKDFAKATSERVKEASRAVARQVERPVIYLERAGDRKDELARRIAKEDGIDEGLICVLETLEPLHGFDVFRNREQKRLELVKRQRKCLHLYHYYLHPILGLMHIRLQTWFPFQVQIWINGREWLARMLDRQNIAYERRDNCFPWIANVDRAQKLMDQQLACAWPLALDLLRRKAHPVHEAVMAPWRVDYYWTVFQSEWATDIMFRDASALSELRDRLVQQGIVRFGCRDVLRFLGKKIPAHGGIPRGYSGETLSDLKERPEGIRLKHVVDGNAVKVYDKQATVLRIETTINRPERFRVFRRPEGDRRRRPAWRPMRKGVADLKRRTEVSQAINDRYLDALTTIEDATSLGELTRALCRPTSWKGRRVRALHPWSPDDLDLLRAVAHGDFIANGFRNADLRKSLYGNDSPDARARRRSAAVTRKIRLLRAHGLVAKRPKSHRYTLTDKGHRIAAALLAAYHANANSLSKLAA